MPKTKLPIARSGDHQRLTRIDRHGSRPLVVRLRADGHPAATEVETPQAAVARQADDQFVIASEAGFKDHRVVALQVSDDLVGGQVPEFHGLR